jgi:gas vesicle protein
MLLMNAIKTGGYMMILNELANQVKKLRGLRTEDIRRNRTKNLILGAGIGSVVGVAAGILFAPKSGKETRQIIADRTGQTVKNLKENVAAGKEKIFSAAENLKENVAAGKEKVSSAAENKKESSK